MKRLLGLAVTCIMALTLCACGASTNLKKVYETLRDDWPADDVTLASSAMELGKDNSYLSIDTNPNDIDDYYSPAALDAIESANEMLGFPDYVLQNMLDTRALDGRQSYSDKQYDASWTYHPNSGLEVMYTTK